MADGSQERELDLEKQIFEILLGKQRASKNYGAMMERINAQLEDSYNKIERKVDSIFKGEINTKKAKENQLNAMRELQASMLKAALIEKQSSIEIQKLETEKIKTVEELLRIRENATEANLEQSIQEEELAIKSVQKLEQQIQAKTEGLKLSQEEIKLKEQEVELSTELRNLELKANKSLGFTGSIMANLAKKSDFAKGIYEKMSEESLKVANGTMKASEKTNVFKLATKQVGSQIGDWWKGTSTTTKLMGGMGVAIMAASAAGKVMGAALGTAGSAMKGLSKHSSNVVTDLTSGLTDMIDKIPIVGGLMSGLVKFWAGLLDLIIGVDDYVVKMGRQMGLSAKESRVLKDNFAAAADSSGKLYVTSERLLEAQSEIVKNTGINNVMSQEILQTNIELADYAGLEAETRMGLIDTARITGETVKDTAKAVLGQVEALEEATGISFNQQQILKEAATLSGRLGLAFSKYPAQLSKSLVITKAMGLDLKQLNNMADSFLDFESSISKEFEAQLLTGKDINLAKAREAFLNNDLETAAAEITRQVGDSNSFLKMNRIQQDSIADAMGMSADQMADMLKKQEMMSRFGAKDQKDLLRKVDLMRQQGDIAKAIRLAGSEEAYNNLINLSTQERLMLAIEKIKVSLVDFLTKEGIVEKIEGFIKFLTSPENIKGIVNTVRTYMAKIIGYVGELTADIIEAVGYIGDVFMAGEKGTNFEKRMYDAADQMRNFSSKFSEGVDVDDAVVFTGNKLVVNKSPEDYVYFDKRGPSDFARGVNSNSNINVNEMVSAIATAIRQQPISVDLKANLAMDGQPAAKVVVSNINNGVLTSFDRQSGPMSLNSYYS
jgi:hypothetical protein